MKKIYMLLLFTAFQLSLYAGIDIGRFNEEQIRSCYETVFQKQASPLIIQAIMDGDYNWLFKNNASQEEKDKANTLYEELIDCLEKAE